MTQSIYCPVIHGGLNINLKEHNHGVMIQNCCFRNDAENVPIDTDLWNHKKLIPIRDLNVQNIWDSKCWPCKTNEDSGQTSYRTGMLEKFGVHTNLSGPQRLDLMFDISCNLACRTCGPHSSTYWQRHIKENKIKINYIPVDPKSRVDDMIKILHTLDLSNLEMVVFAGGETLMGDGYWQVADAIADLVPHAKEKITLSFQTNGTQPIKERYYETISKFELVQLNISLDGVRERFEYLRWPANWIQVRDNIMHMSETLPVNVMFMIEETISILNIYYHAELVDWLSTNFATNRLGDKINHSFHTANNLTSLNLSNITLKYHHALNSLRNNDMIKLIDPTWKENPDGIRMMIAELTKFDKFRNQDWRKTFPEVAEFYSDYL